MEAPQDTYERVVARLKARLDELLAAAKSNGHEPPQPRQLKEQLRHVLKALPAKDYRTLRIARLGEEDRLLDEVLDERFTSAQLEKLLQDETINEIMVNGPSEIFVERQGRMERLSAKFTSAAQLMTVIERLLDSVGLSVNESNPICDARLPDGSRINVIIAPLVLNGPVLTIRRKARQWTMESFLAIGALSPQAAEFLRACVLAKVNMIISGGTSSGKTTLVSVLSAFIPKEERVITIENIAELELPNLDHWVQVVGKAPNLEGRGEVPLRTLVRNALRMRPDRIVLGEARGGEALDVVQAMHTGHDGFLTVLHANNAPAALERLQTLMLMSGLDMPSATCQMQIASAVDLVVHMSRFVDGTRRVATISQVLGASSAGFEMEDLFVFDVEGFSSDGQLRATCRYTGAKPKFLEKFRLNNVEVPKWLTT